VARFSINNGMIYLLKKHFDELGGYDETFNDWGNEDNDLVLRGENKGLELVNTLYKINRVHNTDKERGKNYFNKNIETEKKNNLKKMIINRKNYVTKVNKNGYGLEEIPKRISVKPYNVYDSNLGLVYFPVPFTFYNKIKDYILECCLLKNHNEDHILPITQIDTFEGYKFTVVQDPYTKLVMSYINTIQIPKLPLEIKNNKKFWKKMSFEKFVDNIISSDKEYLPYHYQPQSQIVPNIAELDIYKLENINTDIKKLYEKIIVEDVEKIDTKRKDINLSEYYTNELKEKVANYYNEDFERFGYSK